MVGVLMFSPQAQNMMESGSITYNMDMEFMTLYQVRNMKDCGQMEKEMERESIILPQGPSMMENGKIMYSMEKVFTTL